MARIEDVSSANHIECLVLDKDLDLTSKWLLETYTGRVAVNFANSSGRLVTALDGTYLPISGNKIKRYTEPGNLIIHTTAHIALAGIQPDEDEANLAAVDSASAKVELQQIAGTVGGEAYCLILRMKLGILNGRILAVTYQVTVLSNTPNVLGTEAEAVIGITKGNEPK